MYFILSLYFSSCRVQDNWVAACKELRILLKKTISIIFRPHYLKLITISIIFRPHFLKLIKHLFISFDQRFVNYTNHCFYVRSNIVNSIVGHLCQFTCTLIKIFQPMKWDVTSCLFVIRQNVINELSNAKVDCISVYWL